MKKIWIAIVNRTEAKIFTYKNHEVQFLTKLENPRGRLKDGDINADKPGYFAGANGHGSNRVRKHSPVERVAQDFVLEVIELLEACRLKSEFEELIVVADPHMLGQLRSSYSKDLKRTVRREITRDLANSTVDDIQSRLFSNDSSSPLGLG